MVTRLSVYYNKAIYNLKGKFVGNVNDVVLDLSQGKILGLDIGKSQKKGKSQAIPYESIYAMSDIILVQ